MGNSRGVPKGPLPKFLAVDICVVFCALAGAFLIHSDALRPENFSIYYKLFIPILFIRILTLYAFRLYDFSRGLTAAEIVYFTGSAMLVAHAIETLAVLYIENYHPLNTAASVQPLPVTDPLPVAASAVLEYEISRYVLLLNFLLSWLGAAAWRVLYLQRRRRWAYDKTRMLIVGTGELAESVHRDLMQYSRLGHHVIGMIDDDVENPKEETPVLGKMRDLEDLVRRHDIDEIIITSSKASRQELLDIISSCQATGCRVRLLPELYEVTIGRVEIRQVAGIPLIALSSEPQTEWQRFVKRTFDITVSALALLLSLPLLPFITFIIKRDSKGPVFYRQERVGRGGKRFMVCKFRTMQEDAEAQSGPVLSRDDDPRVTRAGRWLRRMHLDEIPQFWNVLKGDMSLVGPRPERPHFVEQHEETIPAYRLRVRVRPGITGLGQIHGFYNSPVEHKLRYDLAYINNMSFLLDLKILFLTVRVMVTGHGNGKSD